MQMTSIWREEDNGLTRADLTAMVEAFLQTVQKPLKRVLLIPPDITRFNSGAGWLTQIFFEALEPACHCDVLPALGTHRPMTRTEQVTFFSQKIPPDRFLVHDWRNGVQHVGTVPDSLMELWSKGYMRQSVPVAINRVLLNGGYDLILSIGQVVPHEVAGMANYTKNIVIGCGGAEMINASHMLSVYHGLENTLGTADNPVRTMFDYIQEHFLSPLPIAYVMTVTTQKPQGTVINGLYMGGGEESFKDGFLKAATLSREKNITAVSFDECVVYLDPAEFRSTWLGNKAIYRTRKAFNKNKNASLTILAPGFERFGEDAENDRLIRAYGYRGRETILSLLQTEKALTQNLSVAAHLIQGSSDGLFRIRYCTPAQYAEDILSVGYEWGDIALYEPQYAGLTDGWNNGVYFISNPALGLWERL